MRAHMALLLAGLALAASGCGGQDGAEGQGDQSGAAAGTEEKAPATEATGEAVTIAMRALQFVPREATAKVGQTVQWINEDTVKHDVKSTSGPEVESELFGKGGTFDYEATEPGTIEYVCTVHPGMEGTLTVTR